MEKNQTPERILTDLIDTALESAQNRQVAKANKSFLAIYMLCREFPLILWDSPDLIKLTKTYILMYHFDTFDSEEENIEISHWAYFYAYRSYVLAIEQNNPKLIFDSLRDLVLITNECNDNFIDSAAKFYQPRTSSISQQIIQDSRLMAGRIMPLVSYIFILEIEDRFNSFQDDEILEETCNKIEMEYGNISEKLTNDARTISKMMFTNIANKIEARDFLF